MWSHLFCSKLLFRKLYYFCIFLASTLLQISQNNKTSSKLQAQIMCQFATLMDRIYTCQRYVCHCLLHDMHCLLQQVQDQARPSILRSIYYNMCLCFFQRWVVNSWPCQCSSKLGRLPKPKLVWCSYSIVRL